MTEGEKRMHEVLACQHSMVHEVETCIRCGASSEAIEIYEARRAEAQQPVDAGFLGCDGMPISVGDWIADKFDPRPLHVTKLDRTAGGITRACVEGSSACPSNLEIYWRKVSPPAPEKTPGGSPAAPVVAEKPILQKLHDGVANERARRTNVPGGVVAASYQPAETARPAGIESTAPPGPSLAAFTAAVNEHLLPRLPESLTIVTDSVHTGSRMVPHCWVYDGNSLIHEFGGWPFEDEHAVSVASDIACILMGRQSRRPTTEQG